MFQEIKFINVFIINLIFWTKSIRYKPLKCTKVIVNGQINLYDVRY